MYFDGVDDYVAINSVPSIDFSDSFDISLTVVSQQNFNNDYIFSHSSSASNFPLFGLLASAVDSSKLRFLWRNDANSVQYDLTTTAEVFNGSENLVRIIYDGIDTVELHVNGVLSATSTNTPSGSFTANKWGICVLNRATISNYFTGLIYDVSVSQNGSLVSSYQGYGNTNADWEDQVGSNDGTVNGSPALFTGQGFDATLVTAYDQSGNDYDATQNTAANQPLVFAGGDWTRDANGNIHALFDNSNDVLVTSASLSFGTSSRSIFAVCSPLSIGANADAIIQLSDSTATGAGWLIAPELATRTNNITWISSTPASTVSNNIITNIYSSGNLHAGNGMWLDGVSVTRTSGTDGAINTATSPLYIGSNAGGFQPFDGGIAAIVVYASDKSANRAAIEAKISKTITTALS
jgi:hypothetical protein